MFQLDLLNLLERLGISLQYAIYLRMVILSFITLGLACLCSEGCKRYIAPVMYKITRKTNALWDDYLLNQQVIIAFSKIIPPLIMYMFFPLILHNESAGYTERRVIDFIIRLTGAITLGTIIHLMLVFMTKAQQLIGQHEKFQHHYINGLSQFIKLLIIIVGSISVIAVILNRSPLHFIAGLGAAATVLMLIFKDTILGLVAGIQLSANKMLRPGDWITFPKHNIDGIIEQVSLTTVKIRGFDNTIYTLPPYTFITEAFQNWRGMTEYGARRVKRSFCIDVNTIRFLSPDEIINLKEKYKIADDFSAKMPIVNLTIYRKFLEYYLSNKSIVNKDFICMIRQLQPHSNGIPIEFYFFFSETSFVNYEHLQADTLEYFIAIMHDFGLCLYQSPSGNDLRQILLKTDQNH